MKLEKSGQEKISRIRNTLGCPRGEGGGAPHRHAEFYFVSKYDGVDRLTSWFTVYEVGLLFYHYYYSTGFYFKRCRVAVFSWDGWGSRRHYK